MLRQQELMQTQETLAAKEAEVQELKARVAELEQLQQKQNELIALKDSELAAAQQKLGTTQAAAPAGGSAWSGLGPWLGIAGGLVVIAVAAVWWLRRRSAATPAPAPLRRDTARLAAAVPKAEPAVDATKGDEAAPDAQDASVPPGPTEEPGWNRLARPADPEPPKPAAPARAVPTWHAGTGPDVAASAGGGAGPGVALGAGDTTAGASAGGVEVSPLNPAPPGQGRLDLAKAYLDMGDRDTARSLLQEVATRGDSVDVRREAERLLRELG